MDQHLRNDGPATTPPLPAMPVAVTSMPDPPAKPFFSDPTRVISVAAFIFSVVSGLFAAYQTWSDNQQAAVDQVSKLIGEFYDEDEKLGRLNVATQGGEMNLLRSHLRSLALRAASQAQRVKSLIDDGTWQAIAQINAAENNPSAARQAWLSSVDRTQDPQLKVYGLKNVGVVEYQLGLTTQAEAHFSQAIDIANAKSNADHPAFDWPESYRDVSIGEVQLVWAIQAAQASCASFLPHYRSATDYLSKATPLLPADNTAMRNEMILNDEYLANLSTKAASCGADPVDDKQKFCSILGEIRASAAGGFKILEGEPTGETGAFQSRIVFPGAQSCEVTEYDALSSAYTCEFAEHDEDTVKARVAALVGSIKSCSGLGASASEQRTTDTKTTETLVNDISLGGRQSIRIGWRHRKPSDSLPQGRWRVTLDAEGPPTSVAPAAGGP
jgi:tetratricopeptide (TPR) repeat protein